MSFSCIKTTEITDRDRLIIIGYFRRIKHNALVIIQLNKTKQMQIKSTGQLLNPVSPEIPTPKFDLILIYLYFHAVYVYLHK